MVITSGKGLMKARRWAFKAAECLAVALMAISALLILIMPLVIQNQQQTASQMRSSEITIVSLSFAMGVAGIYLIFGIVGIISFNYCQR